MEEEKANFELGQGGELHPIMCVDKTLNELGSFADLVKESEQMGQDWQIVLIASLSGKNGVVPTPSEADQPLELMMDTVRSGGDLSRYVAFDRSGEPVQFS